MLPFMQQFADNSCILLVTVAVPKLYFAFWTYFTCSHPSKADRTDDRAWPLFTNLGVAAGSTAGH
jgi:hypothetical protein